MRWLHGGLHERRRVDKTATPQPPTIIVFENRATADSKQQTATRTSRNDTQAIPTVLPIHRILWSLVVHKAYPSSVAVFIRRQARSLVIASTEHANFLLFPSVTMDSPISHNSHAKCHESTERSANATPCPSAMIPILSPPPLRKTTSTNEDFLDVSTCPAIFPPLNGPECNHRALDTDAIPSLPALRIRRLSRFEDTFHADIGFLPKTPIPSTFAPISPTSTNRRSFLSTSPAPIRRKLNSDSDYFYDVTDCPALLPLVCDDAEQDADEPPRLCMRRSSRFLL